MLVCPITKLPVREVSLDEAKSAIGGEIVPVGRSGRPAEPLGPSERVMLREDDQAAYPIAREVPVLMGPEVLMREGRDLHFDLTQSQYAEAYEEMGHYNEAAEEGAARVASEAEYYFGKARRLSPAEREPFPDPKSAWLDASYDCRAQYDAFKHIAPVKDRIVVQVGGSGIAATQFALAGAAECWLLSPMIGEVERGRMLMNEVGCGDKFRGVAAVGEELPFADNSIDALYSGGCVHHMDTAKAMPEFRRVLKAGGAFAAIDPWKAPLHAFGTKLLGKREESVYCRPIDPERLEPLHATFDESSDRRYGAITRYPMLALSKSGVEFHGARLYRLFSVDDAISSIIPPFRKRWGSSIALLGRKGE